MIRKLFFMIGMWFLSFSVSGEDNWSHIDALLDEAFEIIALEQWDSAYQAADNAFHQSKRVGYSWGKANAQYVKGWIRYSQKDLSEALLLYLEALRIMQTELQSSERTKEKSNIHINIGQIYRVYSNYEGAHKFYEQGLEIARNYDHLSQQIQLIYNDGVAYKYEGNLAKATELFVESRFLSLNNHSPKWYFNSINQLGVINKDLERYDSARIYFDEAFPIADQLSDPSRYRAMIYHNTANSFYLEKKYNSAIEFFERSIQEKPRFISLKDLAEVYLEIGDFENARDASLKAIEYYDTKKYSKESATVFRTLGKASLMLGFSDEASQNFERYSIEIDKYLEDREYTKKLEDAYQIDLLTKQYFLKLEEQKQQARIVQLSWYLGIVVFVFLLIFGIQKWIQRRKREDATDAIKAIFNQSELLKGSLNRDL